jgi:hypothetical protein
LQALKTGGIWVLNVAKDLGTKLLVEIIKTHIPI